MKEYCVLEFLEVVASLKVMTTLESKDVVSLSFCQLYIFNGSQYPELQNYHVPALSLLHQMLQI